MSEQSTSQRFMLAMAALVVIIAGMRAAETLLVPLMLSIFIALIFSPPLMWMKSRGVPGVVAISLIVLLILCIGFVIIAVVGTSVNDFRQDLPEYQRKLSTMFSQLVSVLDGKGIELDLAKIKSGFDPAIAMQLAGNTLASLGNMMTNAFMILLTVIFILAEEMGFSQKLASSRSNSTELTRALADFSASVNRYVGLKSALSLLTGVLVMVLLWALKIDYAIMWGTLAFLLNFIPTVGSILAAVPAVLLALIQLGPLTSLWAAAGYIVINVIVGNVLEPKLMGRGLNLSPLVVFLSLVFWGWVLGPVGMLLSIPLTIMVKIALENDEETRWLGIMLGSGETARGDNEQ